jgi:hypothetical protein
MIRCDFDADGYGWPGADGIGALLGEFALWNDALYPSVVAARRSGALYARRGAIVLHPEGNFASGLRRPAREGTRFPTAGIDFRLSPGSLAVDAGVALPNFNDGFAGAAPDLGCCELGEGLPHFGPRP